MSRASELQRIIEEARERIDELDLRIVELLNRRAEQVVRIGQVKGETGDPIYQPEREEQIFARIMEANEGPLDNDALRRLFERILDEARRVERSS